MIKFKSVKPGPLKDKAMEKYIREQFKKLGDRFARTYNLQTSHWEGEQPEFKPVYRSGGTWAQIVLKPTNEKGAQKWQWIDEGTAPHVIKVKDAKALFFLSMYKAGSMPYSLYTRKAERGGDEVFATEVHHPGSEPRNWTGILTPQCQEMMTDWAPAVFEEAAKISGHGRK